MLVVGYGSACFSVSLTCLGSAVNSVVAWFFAYCPMLWCVLFGLFGGAGVLLFWVG